MQEKIAVLIVEDDPASSDILSYLLRHLGIKPVYAHNGEEALQLLDEHPVQAAFVDLALPGMDGWQFLEAVQANPALNGPPLIAITAYFDSTVKQKALQAGFIACLPKPATQAAIRDVLTLVGI